VDTVATRRVVTDFIFFFLFIVAQLHACVVCIAIPAGLAVVPTQRFYFAFAIFLLF